jgi:hypothetical protein
MKHLNFLPPKTRAVYELFDQLAPKSHIIVGGTALALRIGHRQSEDVDIMCLKDRLQPRIIERTSELAVQQGYSITRLPSQPELVDECESMGEAPDLFQQRFLINDVKIDYFVADANSKKLLSPNPTMSDEFRVADTDEIFRMKSLLLVKRTASRDAFDLYHLMRHEGFTATDFEDAYQRSSYAGSADYGWSKLCRLNFPESDPGYNSLCVDPPSLDEMREYFQVKFKQSNQAKLLKLAGQTKSKKITPKDRDSSSR